MDDYYNDKICIVTGANSGIGYLMSEELVRGGAAVYMAGAARRRLPPLHASSPLTRREYGR